MFSGNYDARKYRGISQKLYLIESIDHEDYIKKEFVIMGSTGNVYTVTIDEKPTCTCPDHKSRHNRCKHIYFVLIKIMGVTEIDKSSYSKKDLFDMFKNIPPVTDLLKVSADLKNKYNQLLDTTSADKSKDIDDFCPICLDELNNGEELLTCKSHCGRHVHKDCFSMYNKNGKRSKCIYCKNNMFSNESEYISLI